VNGREPRRSAADAREPPQPEGTHGVGERNADECEGPVSSIRETSEVAGTSVILHDDGRVGSVGWSIDDRERLVELSFSASVRPAMALVVVELRLEPSAHAGSVSTGTPSGCGKTTSIRP
jgi:hypothetical protein